MGDYDLGVLPVDANHTHDYEEFDLYAKCKRCGFVLDLPPREP